MEAICGARGPFRLDGEREGEGSLFEIGMRGARLAADWANSSMTERACR